jgi:pilus assembly protein Flp/PilA
MLTLLSFMKFYSAPIRARLHSDRGLETVEYALIAALIAVVVITTVTTLGTSINSTFQEILNAIQGPTGGTDTTGG